MILAHLVVMGATFISGKLRPPSSTAGVDASVLFIVFFHIQSVLIFLQSNDTYIKVGKENVFKDSKFAVWLCGVRNSISVPDTMQGKARCIKGSGNTWAYRG